MKKILLTLVLLGVLPLFAAEYPPSYVRVYWNRQYAEFYCTHIVDDTYYLVNTLGVQMAVNRGDLQKILVYPASVSMIKGNR
jgi:hypothetical protein